MAKKSPYNWYLIRTPHYFSIVSDWQKSIYDKHGWEYTLLREVTYDYRITTRDIELMNKAYKHFQDIPSNG